MRVTDNTLRMSFLTALGQAQQRIAATQNQVATGKRVNLPSDDPFAAARIGELDASLSRLDQYRSNGAFATTRLGLVEETLVSVVDNLQRVRELAVQGNNATLSNADRYALATDLRQRLDGVLALANATDSSGRFLFSGYSETTQAFTQTAAGVTYNGDSGQRQLQLSDNRLVAVSDSGSALFQNIASGNGTFALAVDPANTGSLIVGRGSVSDVTAFVPDTYDIEFLTPSSYEVRDSGGALIASGTYSDGEAVAFLGIQIQLDGTPAAGDSVTVTPSVSQDVFTTVQKLIDALEQPTSGTASQALLHSQVGQLITEVDQSIDHMIDTRAEIGARLRTIDEQASLIEGFEFQLTESMSELRDLDYAEALSLLSQQLLGLEAAQKTFAQTQNLSLFRYL
jgi:flagellar hook-associated protein 3 FlgL